MTYLEAIRELPFTIAAAALVEFDKSGTHGRDQDIGELEDTCEATVLIDCFAWRSTPQGSSYWDKVHSFYSNNYRTQTHAVDLPDPPTGMRYGHPSSKLYLTIEQRTALGGPGSGISGRDDALCGHLPTSTPTLLRRRGRRELDMG